VEAIVNYLKEEGKPRTLERISANLGTSQGEMVALCKSPITLKEAELELERAITIGESTLKYVGDPDPGMCYTPEHEHLARVLAAYLKENVGWNHYDSIAEETQDDADDPLTVGFLEMLLDEDEYANLLSRNNILIDDGREMLMFDIDSAESETGSEVSVDEAVQLIALTVHERAQAIDNELQARIKMMQKAEQDQAVTLSMAIAKGKFKRAAEAQADVQRVHGQIKGLRDAQKILHQFLNPHPTAVLKACELAVEDGST
jgi:hypothetical protein